MKREEIWQKLQRLDQDNEFIRRELEEAEAQPLLSDDEASLLVQRYRTGIDARVRLEKAPPNDPAVKADLEKIVNDGDSAATQLHKSYQWLVIQIAADFWVGGSKFQEVSGQGSIGLQRAMQTFHHMRHCRFQDYAAVWIERLVRVTTAQGDNGIELLPWANLAHLQANRQTILKIRLGRTPSYGELAVVMGYLSPEDAAEIVAARQEARPLEPALEDRLRVAKAKAECLHRQPQVANEFGLSLQVTINGKPYNLDNVVSIQMPISREVEELCRCGQSTSKRMKGVWLCHKCLRTRNVGGCGRYGIEHTHRFGQGRSGATVELYDGQRFNIEDDPRKLMGQFLF